MATIRLSDGLTGLVDDPHATPADFLQYLVVADPGQAAGRLSLRWTGLAARGR